MELNLNELDKVNGGSSDNFDPVILQHAKQIARLYLEDHTTYRQACEEIRAGTNKYSLPSHVRQGRITVDQFLEYLAEAYLTV